MASAGLIPVTVLTGFLGSGKTTFVNHLLRDTKHKKRLAVVENEFGEVSIDDGLVLKTDEDVVTMMNGCICCTVRDDLIEALGKLAKRRDQFDAVIIETTGLADPAPVAQTFFVDDSMKEHYYLDAIVTFVDAKHVTSHLDEEKSNGAENEAVEQVAFADVLVLNKTDLVSPSEIEALKCRLKTINQGAKIIETVQSRAPIDEILNIRAFDLARTLAMDDSFLDVEAEHVHDNSVTSVGINIEGEFDPNKLNGWLGELLQTKGADIYRSKGIFAVAGTDERYVFQGVHMLLEMGASSDLKLNLPPWGPSEKRVNKLCFIGKNLDRAKLAADVQACMFNGKLPDPGPKPSKKLRFAVGTAVRANVGVWMNGTVVGHWYREPLWPTGKYVPYQIQVEGGELIYAPLDNNKFVKAA